MVITWSSYKAGGKYYLAGKFFVNLKRNSPQYSISIFVEKLFVDIIL